jgi:hypothetical protein
MKSTTCIANSDNTARLEPKPCRIQFEFKNSFKKSKTFKLASYVANGMPLPDVPATLEFTSQNAADPSKSVIFDLPHQDRVNTILLRYREEKNKNVGFDIYTIVELQGPRNENNCFDCAKQTTIIRYIDSQGNHNVVGRKFINIYSRGDGDEIHSKPTEHGQVPESLKYIVDVKHSHKSTSLLDFNTTIHIKSREDNEQPPTSNGTFFRKNRRKHHKNWLPDEVKS